MLLMLKDRRLLTKSSLSLYSGSRLPKEQRLRCSGWHHFTGLETNGNPELKRIDLVLEGRRFPKWLVSENFIDSTRDCERSVGKP